MKTLLSVTQDENGTIRVSSDVYPVETGSAGIPLPENKHPELAEALRSWRRDKAREQNLSAFIVLTNRALLEISNACPMCGEELLAVRGFGPVLMERYGDEILEIVGQYAQANVDSDTGEL